MPLTRILLITSVLVASCNNWAMSLPSDATDAMSVSELASKPFIQLACASPMKPQSVLSFFYGVNYMENEHEEEMKSGIPLFKMFKLWFKGGPEYDALSQPFAPVIRAAGQKLLPDEFHSSVDGLMSQVLLCDQLSRNCFRGTDEAFQYDNVSLEMALKLVHQFYPGAAGQSSSTLSGTFYPSYIRFLLTPLIHSEELDNHELALKVLDHALECFQDQPELCKKMDGQRPFLVQHKEVIERFGRYPHRNAKMERTNTPEEQAWLDDKDNLPGWAKSQG